MLNYILRLVPSPVIIRELWVANAETYSKHLVESKPRLEVFIGFLLEEGEEELWDPKGLKSLGEHG